MPSRAAGSGLATRVVIISGDRDVTPVVDGYVPMLNPAKEFQGGPPTYAGLALCPTAPAALRAVSSLGEPCAGTWREL